jgi:hypothetical protein
MGGPGSGRSSADSKSHQIRALLGSGMSALEMATIVGCTTNLVHVVQSHEKARRDGRPPRRPAGRVHARTEGASQASTSASLDAVLAAVRDLERERDELRQIVEQIRELLDRAVADGSDAT